MASTFVPRASQLHSDWHLLDAEGQILGRLASQAAMLLMGKHKPDYTPFLKTGDHVVVINAEKVRLTGRKEEQKIYYRHSGYPGGIKHETLRQRRAKTPERVIEDAILGMLPKNKLGRQLATRLRIYKGSTHPHEGQQPKELKIQD